MTFKCREEKRFNFNAFSCLSFIQFQLKFTFFRTLNIYIISFQILYFTCNIVRNEMMCRSSYGFGCALMWFLKPFIVGSGFALVLIVMLLVVGLLSLPITQYEGVEGQSGQLTLNCE